MTCRPSLSGWRQLIIPNRFSHFSFLLYVVRFVVVGRRCCSRREMDEKWVNLFCCERPLLLLLNERLLSTSNRSAPVWSIFTIAAFFFHIIQVFELENFVQWHTHTQEEEEKKESRKSNAELPAVCVDVWKLKRSLQLSILPFFFPLAPFQTLLCDVRLVYGGVAQLLCASHRCVTPAAC